jgi:hypothetical protein
LKTRAVLVVTLFCGLVWATGRFGLLGAISTVVTVSMLERVVIGLKVIRILKVTASDWVLLKDVGRVLMAAGVAALAALSMRLGIATAPPLMMLAATGATFVLAYGVALAGLKILMPEEILLIDRQLERLGLPLSLRLQLSSWVAG